MMFGINIINAQNLQCSTQHDAEFFLRLENNVANSSTKKGKVARFVPIEFHLVADNDGTNTLTEDGIIEKLCIINERFENIEMHFYIAGINIISNTQLNHMPFTGNSALLMRNNKNPNAVNIFLVNETLIFDSQIQEFVPSNSAGFYSGNNDIIAVSYTHLTLPTKA